MIFILIGLQLLTAGVVLFVLKNLLERELLSSAMERLAQWRPDPGAMVREVFVLAAGRLSPSIETGLKDLIREKCPEAAVRFTTSREIWGGIVIQAGDVVLDFSLLNRLKHLFGQRE